MEQFDPPCDSPGGCAASPTTALQPECEAASPTPTDSANRHQLRERGKFNITSQADADALSNCTTLYGDVQILGTNIKTISFPGVAKIWGSFAASSCGMLSNISAPVLQTVSNDFNLSNLPLLSHINMPGLWFIGDLNWDDLPVLTYPTFNTSTVRPMITGPSTGAVRISNTSLSNISFVGFDGMFSINVLQITNNSQLNNIAFTGLQQTGDLEIAGNGPNAQILLPDITTVANMTLKNTVNISIPNLMQIRGSLILENNDFSVFSAPKVDSVGGSYGCENENYYGCGAFRVSENSFTELSMPVLDSIYGLLTIKDNPLLARINFQKFQSFGSSVRNGTSGLHSFTIANNPALDTISFPELYYSLNFNLTGNFKNVSMPPLAYMRNAFHVNSTIPSLDCSFLDELNYKLVSTNKQTYGHYDLVNAFASSYWCNAIVPGTAIDVAKHWKKPVTLSQPAKIGIIAVSVLVGIALFATLIWYWRRWWEKYQRRGEISGVNRHVSLENLDRLPAYRRTGKPGEVPPGYHEVHEAQQTNVESMPATEAVMAPRYSEIHLREDRSLVPVSSDTAAGRAG